MIIASCLYNQPLFVKQSLQAIADKTTKGSYRWSIWSNEPPHEADWAELITDAVKNGNHPPVLPKHVVVGGTGQNIGNASGYEAAWARAKEKWPDYKPSFYVKADDDTVVLTYEWDKPVRRAFKLCPELGVLSLDINIDKMVGPNKISHLGEGLRIQEFENPCVGGGFTIYSANLRTAIGPLRTDLGLYGGEDVDYCTRARAAGFRTGYLLNARCVHLCRNDDGSYTPDNDDKFSEWKIAYHNHRTKQPFEEWERENR